MARYSPLRSSPALGHRGQTCDPRRVWQSPYGIRPAQPPIRIAQRSIYARIG